MRISEDDQRIETKGAHKDDQRIETKAYIDDKKNIIKCMDSP